jgi:thioredoxin 1
MRGITYLLFIVFSCSFLYAEEAQIRPPLKPPGGADEMVDSSQQIADIIVKSNIPVFVDFWAVWCGPCKLLNPIVAELEKEFKGKVLFLKVNVDIHKSISNYFQVSAIPAVFILKDKTVVNMFPGLQRKETYAAALNSIIGTNSALKPDSLINAEPVKAQSK